MARRIELGSPSFVEVAITSLIGAFADATYPVKVVITNNMPRDISLPDIGLFLRHVCDPNGENRREVMLRGFDQLQRLASNIGQISMLNDYQYASMTVEEMVDEPAQEDSEAAAKSAAEAESKTGDESGAGNGLDLTGTVTGEEGNDTGTGETETNPVEGADVANGASDAGKDATPPAATKKASHSHKTKGG